MQKLYEWWSGPAEWYEIWKAQNGTNLFFTGILCFGIISTLAYLWG